MTRAAHTTAFAVALALALVAVSRGSAQETRASLLDEVPTAADDAARLELLMAAANPELAPLDSLWARGVHTLADLLIDLEDRTLAGVWLDWVVRHGADWPIDRGFFRPGVVGEYEEAVQRIEDTRSEADALATTRWVWPESLDRTAPGTLEVVAGNASAPLDVSIIGAGAIQGSESLDPGTYELVVSADGYEAARITREVLPGVTTVLEVDLIPVLDPAVEEEVVRSLAVVAYREGGQRVCVNGVLDRQGVVLTVLDPSVAGAALQVTTNAGTFGDVQIVERDAETAVVALRLAGAPTEPPARADAPDDDAYAWAIYREGCADVTSSRTRLAAWTPAGPVRVATSFPGDALGAPVIDRTGGVLGLVTATDLITPISRAQQLVDIVIAQAEPPPDAGGGGGVWKWIGGAGAAGVLGAVLLSDGGEPEDETGTLVIQIPGG